MEKKVLFCISHPTRKAKRKCYYCGRPLCPDCQRRMSGHVFCGALCHEHFLGDERQKRFAKIRLYIAAHPATRWAVLGALLALLVFISYTTFIISKTSAYATPEAEIPQARTPKLSVDDVNWSLPGLISLTAPADRSDSADSAVKVVGNAPQGAIVGLFVNNTLIDAVLAAEGGFAFDEVSLSKDVNIIQARYYDRYGTSAYSNAVLVFYRGRTPARLKPISIAKVPEELPHSADNIIRGDPRSKNVYLTFDAGSTDNVADDVLRVLAQHQVRLTVFLTGQFIERYPRTVLRIVEDGHEIGNHTFSHPHLTTYLVDRRHRTLKGVTRELLQDELKRTEEAFYRLTGRKMAPLWRAPFGEHNKEIRRWAKELGYTHIGWTQGFDSLDWVAKKDHHLYFPAPAIKKRLIDLADGGRGDGANGAIILMHLGSERPPGDRIPVVLSDILGEYRKRGYNFEKIGHIISSEQ